MQSLESWLAMRTHSVGAIPSYSPVAGKCSRKFVRCAWCHAQATKFGKNSSTRSSPAGTHNLAIGRNHHVYNGKRPRISKIAAALQLPDVFPIASSMGVWSVLIMAGALGTWSERTNLGALLSGPLVTTLAGMAFVNLGIIPHGAAEVAVVFKFLLPLAIPMLLFGADLWEIWQQSGRLLPAFLLGSACTVLGSVVAYLVVPLQSLGADGLSIAAALTARHIGGAVNYIAVSETLGTSRSALSAGLAADDLILVLYFTALYSLAAALVPRGSGSPSQNGASAALHGESIAGKTLTVHGGLVSLALSSCVVALCSHWAAAWGVAGQSIVVITCASVAIATLMPRQLAPLRECGAALALMIMQVFFASVGASANVPLVLSTAPALFVFSLLALSVHLGAMLLIGRALSLSWRELLLASNANIGGPSTVAGFAVSKGWQDLMVPAVLTSTLGYVVGTLAGLAFARYMPRFA